MPDTPTVHEAPRCDAHDLRNFLDNFCRQNASCRDIEHRWLAAYAEDLKLQAYNVKVGNHTTIRKQVEEFRLREIEGKRTQLQKQLAVLESEEKAALRAIEEYVEKIG